MAAQSELLCVWQTRELIFCSKHKKMKQPVPTETRGQLTFKSLKAKVLIKFSADYSHSDYYFAELLLWRFEDSWLFQHQDKMTDHQGNCNGQRSNLPFSFTKISHKTSLQFDLSHLSKNVFFCFLRVTEALCNIFFKVMQLLCHYYYYYTTTTTNNNNNNIYIYFIIIIFFSFLRQFIHVIELQALIFYIKANVGSYALVCSHVVSRC